MEGHLSFGEEGPDSNSGTLTNYYLIENKMTFWLILLGINCISLYWNLKTRSVFWTTFSLLAIVICAYSAYSAYAHLPVR